MTELSEIKVQIVRVALGSIAPNKTKLNVEFYLSSGDAPDIDIAGKVFPLALDLPNVAVSLDSIEPKVHADKIFEIKTRHDAFTEGKWYVASFGIDYSEPIEWGKVGIAITLENSDRKKVSFLGNHMARVENMESKIFAEMRSKHDKKPDANMS